MTNFTPRAVEVMLRRPLNAVGVPRLAIPCEDFFNLFVPWSFEVALGAVGVRHGSSWD